MERSNIGKFDVTSVSYRVRQRFNIFRRCGCKRQVWEVMGVLAAVLPSEQPLLASSGILERFLCTGSEWLPQKAEPFDCSVALPSTSNDDDCSPTTTATPSQSLCFCPSRIRRKVRSTLSELQLLGQHHSGFT